MEEKTKEVHFVDILIFSGLLPRPVFLFQKEIRFRGKNDVPATCSRLLRSQRMVRRKFRAGSKGKKSGAV